PRRLFWLTSRSSAYHSRTSVRMRSTSVDASATLPRKPPRGLTCTTSTFSLVKTRRSSNACAQTTRTSIATNASCARGGAEPRCVTLEVEARDEDDQRHSRERRRPDLAEMLRVDGSLPHGRTGRARA